MNGVIKKIMPDGKTFGFITPDGETQDLFFHGNDLVGVEFAEVKEGDRVTFDKKPGEGGKGPSAVNVQRAA